MVTHKENTIYIYIYLPEENTWEKNYKLISRNKNEKYYFTWKTHLVLLPELYYKKLDYNWNQKL